VADDDIKIRIGADASGVKQGTQEAQGILTKGLDFLKQHAAVSYAAAGYAAFSFAKDAVQAASEAEEAQRKLGDAYERFPALADVSLKSLNELADAQMNRSRFDDDAVRSSEAVLAQFGLTGKEIEKLIPLVVDYAAKTGQDVPTSAEALGKALLGNTRGLKDVGIDMQTTGDHAVDFQTLIDELGTHVRGFAETDLETTSGKMAALNVKMGELKEKIGTELIPILSDLVDALGPVIDATGTLIEHWDALHDRVENMKGPLGDFGVFLTGSVIDVLRKAKEEIGKTDDALAFLWGNLQQVTDVGGGFVSVLHGIADAADAAWRQLKRLADLIPTIHVPNPLSGLFGSLNPFAASPAPGTGTFAGVGGGGRPGVSALAGGVGGRAVGGSSSSSVTLNVHGNIGDPVVLGRRILAALDAAGRVDGNRHLRRLAS
jgi:phage-related minor tail protein